MKKIDITDFANPIQTLADIVGPETAKIVGVGLTAATAAQMIALMVAPAVAGGVAAIGMVTGMVLQYLRGRHQKKMMAAMAKDGLTPEGPAMLCGEHSEAEFQAVQQQAMENGR